MLISLACSNQISLLQISPELPESVEEIEGHLKGRRGRKGKVKQESPLERWTGKKVKKKDKPRTER